MRVGIIGTGAISAKHAVAYRNIGFEIVACTNKTESKGREFAAAYGAEYVATVEELCRHPKVDYVDLCTFPNFRLPVVELCAQNGKHLLVQKPMAIDLATAQAMISVAAAAGIQLGVVSQHRFDDSTLFLKRAISKAASAAFCRPTHTSSGIAPRSTTVALSKAPGRLKAAAR